MAESLELLVEVDADGTIRAMHEADGTMDGLVVEGQASIRRASRILPIGWFRRFAFLGLRWLCGEHGRVTDWMRRWRGPWLVDLRLSGGAANAGVFADREEALRYERKWLVQHGLH